jgi:hypothetical protein
MLYFVRGTGATTGVIKQTRTHNRSENGRGAWVASCAHPTHTDTDTTTNLWNSHSDNTRVIHVHVNSQSIDVILIHRADRQAMIRRVVSYCIIALVDATSLLMSNLYELFQIDYPVML